MKTSLALRELAAPLLFRRKGALVINQPKVVAEIRQKQLLSVEIDHKRVFLEEWFCLL